MTIQNTKAFKKLTLLSQQMALKRANRIIIEQEIIIARNIGLGKWKTQNPLQERWRAIVAEIIENE